MNKRIYGYAIICIIVLCFSTGCATIDFKKQFNTLIQCEDRRTGGDHCIAMRGIEHLDYDDSAAKNNLDFLLNAATSPKMTNCYACPMDPMLAEGDIATLIIFEVSDFSTAERNSLFPQDVLKIFEWRGTASFIDWLQKNEENRKVFVEKLRKLVATKKL